jgi:hypothetical protein
MENIFGAGRKRVMLPNHARSSNLEFVTLPLQVIHHAEEVKKDDKTIQITPKLVSGDQFCGNTGAKLNIHFYPPK